jgi:hypothetical protein
MNAVLCGMSDVQGPTDRWCSNADSFSLKKMCSESRSCLAKFESSKTTVGETNREKGRERGAENYISGESGPLLRYNRYGKQEHSTVFFPFIYRGTQTERGRGRRRCLETRRVSVLVRPVWIRHDERGYLHCRGGRNRITLGFAHRTGSGLIEMAGNLSQCKLVVVGLGWPPPLQGKGRVPSEEPNPPTLPTVRKNQDAVCRSFR